MKIKLTIEAEIPDAFVATKAQQEDVQTIFVQWYAAAQEYLTMYEEAQVQITSAQLDAPFPEIK